MIIAIMGLTGSGKSTVAKIIASHRGAHLFDMDCEFPTEYVVRRRDNEIVPVADVKAYQRAMVERMLDIENERDVVMAGFFLDDELPKLLEEKAFVVWINLTTDDKELLLARIQKRKNHFPAALEILEANWPYRSDQIVGKNMVDCSQSLDYVIGHCLSIVNV